MKTRFCLACAVCLLLLGGTAEAQSTSVPGSAVASPVLAEAITGVAGIQTILDSDGAVVAVSIPAEAMRLPQSAAKDKDGIIMCGARLDAPAFGGTIGLAVAQDAQLPIGNANYYYLVL